MGIFSNLQVDQQSHVKLIKRIKGNVFIEGQLSKGFQYIPSGGFNSWCEKDMLLYNWTYEIVKILSINKLSKNGIFRTGGEMMKRRRL